MWYHTGGEVCEFCPKAVHKGFETLYGSPCHSDIETTDIEKFNGMCRDWIDGSPVGMARIFPFPINCLRLA
jgi:hypothetical protein